MFFLQHLQRVHVGRKDHEADVCRGEHGQRDDLRSAAAAARWPRGPRGGRGPRRVPGRNSRARLRDQPCRKDAARRDLPAAAAIRWRRRVKWLAWSWRVKIEQKAARLNGTYCRPARASLLHRRPEPQPPKERQRPADQHDEEHGDAAALLPRSCVEKDPDHGKDKEKREEARDAFHGTIIEMQAGEPCGKTRLVIMFHPAHNNRSKRYTSPCPVIPLKSCARHGRLLIHERSRGTTSARGSSRTARCGSTSS